MTERASVAYERWSVWSVVLDLASLTRCAGHGVDMV